MKYYVKQKQVSYGEAIGIILLENYIPFIPGDVANATTYNFPVRFQRVSGFTVDRIMNHDMTILDEILEAAKKLQAEGVRAITGDCGFMVLYQDQISEVVDVPVFMSSLLQIPFIRLILNQEDKIGVITSNAQSLDENVLTRAGVQYPQKLVIEGLEKKDHFFSVGFKEEGMLDTQLIEEEVLEVAHTIIEKDPTVKALLLECSILPPYGAAIQAATGLPVFDYMTMINFVFSAVVKHTFQGYM